MSTLSLQLNQPLKSVITTDRFSARSSPTASTQTALKADRSAKEMDQADSPTVADIEAQRVEQLAALVETIRSEFQALQARSQNTVADLQRTAVEVAILIAAKLLHNEEIASRVEIEETAQRLIEKLNLDNQITLHLHPDDLNAIKATTCKELQSDNVNLVPDSGLRPGDCRADDGENGLIASLDLQLAELRHQLLENISGGADAA